MTSHEHDSGTTKQPIGLNRRTLIRTGAHVAWAVPAVAMVTPAPAAAASGPAALSVTATNGGWTGADAAAARFAVTLNITNNNNAATTALRVTFTLPAGVTASPTPLPTGWTILSGDGSNSITLQRTTQLAGNDSTGAVVVTFDPVDTAAFTSIPVAITAAPGAPGTSGSTSTTVAARADLSVTATNGGWTGDSTPNARFAITFNVTNNTAAPATRLRVAFTLSNGVTIQNLTLPDGWFSSSSGNVITLGTNTPLAANASTGSLIATFNPADAFVGILIPVNITATSNPPGTSGNTSTTIAAATPPVLTLSSPGTWSGEPTNRMVFSERIIGNTSLPATTGLQVLFTLPTGLRDVTSATATGTVGWNAVIDPSVATTGLITFTATGQVPGKASRTFTARLEFATDAATRDGTVSILVSATNPGTTDASGTATKK